MAVAGNPREPRSGAGAIDALRRFAEAAIGQRNELVLPLHGGPDPAWDATCRRLLATSLAGLGTGAPSGAEP